MNKNNNKKPSPETGNIEAGIQQQIQQLAKQNGLKPNFLNISLENETPNNDSIELKKTTKGVTWNIKCYGEGNEAMQRANTLFDECKKLYGESEDESE